MTVIIYTGNKVKSNRGKRKIYPTDFSFRQQSV